VQRSEEPGCHGPREAPRTEPGRAEPYYGAEGSSTRSRSGVTNGLGVLHDRGDHWPSTRKSIGDGMSWSVASRLHDRQHKDDADRSGEDNRLLGIPEHPRA
jgi:hypothetical protein